MRLVLVLFLGVASLLQAQRSADGSRERDPLSERDMKLPNGKSQQEEILKAEHQKTLEDVSRLVKLSQDLQDEIEKDDRHVLSIASLKKTEEIEKLAKKIRTRLKR